MPAACHLCRVQTVKRRATASAPHRHVADDLVPVLLAGIDVAVCPSCRAEALKIRSSRSLHHAIAHALVRQPERLAGMQIRFLRRHAGITAGRFAALLGIDAAHLSRVENGKIPALGVPADRLVRVLTAPPGGSLPLRRTLEDLADAASAAGRSGAGEPLRFKRASDGKWRRVS